MRCQRNTERMKKALKMLRRNAEKTENNANIRMTKISYNPIQREILTTILWSNIFLMWATQFNVFRRVSYLVARQNQFKVRSYPKSVNAISVMINGQKQKNTLTRKLAKGKISFKYNGNGFKYKIWWYFK